MLIVWIIPWNEFITVFEAISPPNVALKVESV